MHPRDPIANLPTHEVANTPPFIGDQDLWGSDVALRQGVAREGGGWANAHLANFGKLAGREEVFELADQANRFAPELKAFDRYGMRINQVSFHPAYRALHETAVCNRLASFAGSNPKPGGGMWPMRRIAWRFRKTHRSTPDGQCSG